MDHERIGKYRIVGALGRGTMGEVFKALDPVLNRHVALKTMTVSAGHYDEAFGRFQREAQAAALLNHPNIVTIYDFGREEGLLYIAMELLEGEDLRDALDRGRPFSLEEKLAILDGVLAALEYAHGKGVVHRDVKPANIHLVPGSLVKIMDFGLARLASSEMTQDGVVLGTPNYMSPEQALGGRVDGRSDLFSAGVVLYELLTAHKPFEAESTPAVLYQVVHTEPPPLRRWARETPDLLAALVERALCKDRERRFASASEMRAALTAARPGIPLPPRPAPKPPLLPPRPNGTPARSLRMAGAPPVLTRPSAVPASVQATSISTNDIAGALDAALPPLPEPLSPASPDAGSAGAPGPVTSSLRRGAVRLIATGGLAAAVVVVAGAWWWSTRPRAAAPVPAEQALRHGLVAAQVQLARRELEDKDYVAAARDAETALRLVPSQPEAARVLAEARERTRELQAAVASARTLLDQGDGEAASRQLSRVLELDPRHPAATELSARLNSAFQGQAEQAAAAMRSERVLAEAAGVAGTDAFAAASETARAATALASAGEYADASRSFFEARDGFDRARRAARARTDRPPSRRAAAAPATHAFEAEPTAVTTAAATGAPAGFDRDGVTTRRPPEFSGQLQFEVEPQTVRAGDAFVVRIQAANEGSRKVRVRSLTVATIVDGRRTPVAAAPLARELPARQRTLLAQYSDVWQETSSWALEAVVTSDRNETITARLRSR